MLRLGLHSCKWHGRLPLAVGYRWQSADQKVQEEVKPFSAIPSPSGALPIIGHQRLLKDVTSISKFVTEKFRELGPIFRLHFIGKIMRACVCIMTAWVSCHTDYYQYLHLSLTGYTDTVSIIICSFYSS